MNTNIQTSWRYGDDYSKQAKVDHTMRIVFYVLKGLLSRYDIRVKAVKLARLCRTEGIEIPKWLQELIK